ncbi:MAG: flavodoxin domain-containing protein, partial [Candidatus Thermoplasmatota archaeon]|nr:flavodoxin domain-containing protein [Candidatus Thermoplasmatota archaeon]
MSNELSSFLSDGDRSLHILFGSQSGNSEDLAVKFGKQAKSYGLESTVHDMDGFDFASLASMSRVLIICSTWGEGEQPDNAEDLWNIANAEGAPSLAKTNFSVCALGDTSYELFCESGKEWDKRFEELGGTRLVARVDCDVDYDKPAAEWGEKALAHMAAVDGSGIFQKEMVESISSFVKSGGSVSTTEQTPVAEASVSSDSSASGSLQMDGDRSLHILFGSQSGNAEGLAAKIGKRAEAYGLASSVHDMDGFDLSSLSSMSRVLVVCSTWGEGEQPDNAEELWQAANGESAPSLANMHFSVCALGDTSYELFCESGKEWD